MRYTYACFKGYIGFWNGLGLDKVEIDFTKCRNNIVVISGINGCGKSTLMNALNPFPDSSNAFAPNMNGEKLLSILNNGDTYNIRIVSPVDNSGNRKQTKAFISKNGLELNSTGNVTSYKDVIFSEFELDSNYISLSQLSGTNRGLADKKPAERKKFVSNIIDNLETYNQIYKTLNKKSLIYKSHINTLHTKIQNIGDKTQLELDLRSLQKKADSISSEQQNLNNTIVSLETKISINQEEAKQIQDIKIQYDSVNSQVLELRNRLKVMYNKTKIKESEIEDRFRQDSDLMKEYKYKLESENSNWKNKVERYRTTEDSIIALQADIDSYNSSVDVEIEKKYIESNNHIDSIKKSLKGYGVEANTELILPLISLLNFYERFSRQIDSFYDGLDPEKLKYIVYNYDPEDGNKLQNQLNDTFASIDKTKEDILTIKENMSKLSVLDNRPKNCKLDKCPFISEALEIKSNIGNLDLEEELSKILEAQIKLSESVTEIQKNIEIYHLCVSKRTEYDAIINGIREIGNGFVLFNDDLLSDTDRFNRALVNMNMFNNQKDPTRLRDSLNLLRELDSELKINNSLSIEYKAYKEKKEMIESTVKLVDKLSKDLLNINKEIEESRKSIDNYKTLINTLDLKLRVETEYMDINTQFNDKSKVLYDLKLKIDDIEKKSSDELKAINQINDMKNKIIDLNRELNPITNSIQRISGQLTLLDSYYEEYNRYNTSYNMIETLKKYCSPTGGGIQTLFMQLYMSKTLELSNQVLGMIFGGEYRLLDFVINQNEFRIPFIGSGLPVDDISSGSTSQICIMGMVISLVLLHQASTKFNIARLDEIDGGLDHRNRFEFVNVLYQSMPILNIEQLFIISHSMELETSNVDIIKLKTYSDFEDGIPNDGNVIYDYSEVIKKTNI